MEKQYKKKTSSSCFIWNLKIFQLFHFQSTWNAFLQWLWAGTNILWESYWEIGLSEYYQKISLLQGESRLRQVVVLSSFLLTCPKLLIWNHTAIILVKNLEMRSCLEIVHRNTKVGCDICIYIYRTVRCKWDTVFLWHC